MQKRHNAETATVSKVSCTRRVIAWCTLIFYIGQPFAATAQIIADQAAAAQNRPVIDTTANGIPLVQIATPNSSGLSHNQYSQYNVDPSGAILNNSSSTVLTQQAGYVPGNQNMANGTARIILNEVTSTSASQLNGYTEVAGARAEVIIANPNGISCNGCGFINTSRGVLTTGTPVFGGSGSLDFFRVSGGEINIGASGLNASNTNQLDLISRSVKVNGELWGSDINVITGTNQVNYANLGVQVMAGDANKPTVGIDVAQLGGMYANKIRLVGTEAGVGVNSQGTIATRSGDINIDTQGLVTLAGSTNAGGNLSIKGTGITSTGTLGAGIDANGGGTQSGTLDLDAGQSGNIDNAGRMAGNTITSTSDTFTNNGTVIGDNITLRANTLNNNANATIASTQSVNLVIQNTLNNRDGATILSLGDVNIGANLTQDANGYLTGNTGTINNSSATIEAGNNLRIGANQITNQRTLVGVEFGAEYGQVYVDGNPRYDQSYADEQYTANTTAAAQLLAGNNIWLSGGTLNNNFSTVAAAYTLNSSGLVNIVNTGDAFRQRTTVTNGWQDSWGWVVTGGHDGWCSYQRCWVYDYSYINTPIPYTPAPTFVDIGLPQHTNTGNTSVTVGTVGPITVPTNGLYTINNQPGQQYLVVTAPRFTSYQNFLSSDYMMSRLVLDPAQIQKRLGDGFYEQKLIADQILQATGRRTLTGYSNIQAGYQALMDDALAASTELNLIPGVALTKDQIAALRRDIVWMVAEDVKLPDGTTTRALAPKVYFSQSSQMKLNPGGALIAANEINFKSGGVFDNSGTVISDVATNLIVGDLINRGSLQSGGVLYVNAANDISNLSGNIKGQDVTLVAGRDIRNERTATNTDTSTALGLAAGISASNDLKMTAGRDLSIVAAEVKAGGNANLNAGNNITVGTLATQENSSGAYNAYINRVSNLGSKLEVGGNLAMQSGNDLQLTAAKANVGGNMSLNAGGDINLLTVKDTLSSGYDSGVGQGKNYDETVIGTSLNAGGNISLQAGKPQKAERSGSDDQHRTGGGNINMLSANINSDNGNVNVLAANNVNIGTTDEVHTAFSQTHSEESGFLSSKSTDTRTSSKQVNAIGSSISGDSITIQAGNAKKAKEDGSKDTGGNITVTGSSIAGTNDVILDAANNINIQAGTSTSNTSSYSHTSESGLMSNGGWNITIGSREQTDKYDSSNTLQSQNRSMIGSTNGNLTLKAGGNALVSGSDVFAAQDLNIAAKDITINSGLDQSSNSQSHDTKQSGLTIGVSSSVTDAGKTYEQMKQLAEQSKNKRIKALAIAAAALAAANAANNANVSVSVTAGASASHNDSTQLSSRTSGSTLNAGNNLNLVATAGKNEDASNKGGNITIQGSDIKAGNDISLSADNAINLLADQNTASQISHNTSSSSGAGVGVSYGKSGFAGGATGNAALARGNADGNDVTWTNSHLNAGNTLNLKSGGDTNLKGATANGKQIIADIGGNLNIASLQDTSTYASKQASISGTATGGTGASATISGSQTTINGNYASVQEQSGLKAGDNGFQIKVKGNTDLKGAVIESSDAAIKDNKNTLTTATLTTSEIHNRSDYDALSVSVSAGTGGVGAPMTLAANDKDESKTRSGISGAVINITDEKKQKELTGKEGEATVASLNRDVATGKDTSGSIGNNLDVAEVQASLTVTQTFVQQANTFVASMATKSEKLKAEGDAKQKQAAEEIDPARKQQLQTEAQNLYQQSEASAADSKQWGPGGIYRQIATALTAAAGGNVTGTTSQLVQGAAVNYLQSLGAEQIKALAKDIGGEGSPAHIALHGLLACGGASAQGSDCGSAAMGASAGVVINTLLQGNPETMTATQKENRKNLVATLVTGIAVAAGSDSSGIVAATNAATIETENNAMLAVKHVNDPKLAKVCAGESQGVCGLSNRVNQNGVTAKMQDMPKKDKWQIIEYVDASGNTVAYAAYNPVTKNTDLMMDPQDLKIFMSADTKGLQAVVDLYNQAPTYGVLGGEGEIGKAWNLALQDPHWWVSALTSVVGSAAGVAVSLETKVATMVVTDTEITVSSGLKNLSGDLNAARNQVYGNGGSASPSPGTNSAGNSGAGVNTIPISRPDFYVTTDGTAVPATGYRVMVGTTVENVTSTGTIIPTSPTNPIYFTFDNITGMSSKEASSVLQIPYTPTHWASFDTLQLIGNDLKVPTGLWNTSAIPEPIVSTYPAYGVGGATQGITNSPVKTNGVGKFPTGAGQ